MSTFLELRVHGVHGTPPADMLGVDDVEQVAGDTITGIYRPKGTIPGRTIPNDSAVEAYSWGALTSGTKSVLSVVQRMLWLTLLPFALANVAAWARLTAGTDTWRSRVSGAGVRLFALTLSVFLILTPALLFSDLFAWQCFQSGTVSCPSIPAPLQVLAGWQPSQRLAVGMIPALAVIALLWWLSRLTHARYEDVPDPQARLLASGSSQDDLLVRHPRMFSGQQRTAALRDLHAAAQLSTVTGFTAVHVAAHSQSWLPWTFAVIAVLSLGCAMVLVSRRHPHDIDLPSPNQLRDYSPYARRLRLVAFAATVVWFGILLLGRLDVTERGQFTGHNVWFIGAMLMLTATHILVIGFERRPRLTVVALVIFLLLVAGGAWLWNEKHGLGPRQIVIAALVSSLFWVAMATMHRLSDSNHADAALPAGSTAWRGASASVLMGAAAWITLLFTSTAVTFTANYLNGPDQGPGDLISDSRIAPAISTPDSSKAYVALGDLTVSDALVTVRDGEVIVRSGTISADRFTSPGADLRLTVPTLTTRAAKIDPGKATTLHLVDVCLVPDVSTAKECVRGSDSGADLQFVSDADLDLDLRYITVKAADRPVGLVATTPISAHLAIPQVLIWTPLAQLVWLVGGLVLVALALVRMRPMQRTVNNAADDDKALQRQYRHAVASARARAAIAHRVEALMDIFGYFTTWLLLVLMSLTFSGLAPWQLFGPGNPWGDWSGLARSVTDLSLWVALGSCLLLIALASRIRSSEDTRRAVAVVWDLATFWPRIAHPLAPPCYTERVVPEISKRVRWARVMQPDGIVVLAGHSQGSLIAATVASRLNNLDKLRLLTFGSQIRGLYGRVFPRVFGPDAMGYAASTPTRLSKAMPDALDDGSGYPQAVPPAPSAPSLRARLEAARPPGSRSPAWVNLFRRTDPLGFRVFADGDSTIDLPTEEITGGVDDPNPPLRGHGGYMFSQRYLETVQAWTGETPLPPPSGIAPLPRTIPT